MIYISIYHKEQENKVATTAKIFKNGRSQAVRLPKEFRFEGSEVKIKREGKAVIIEPIEKTAWPKGFWNKFNKDEDFPVPAPLPQKTLDLD